MAFGQSDPSVPRKGEPASVVLSMFALAGVMLALGLFLPSGLDGVLKRAAEVILGN
jgi:hypothetical protein